MYIIISVSTVYIPGDGLMVCPEDLLWECTRKTYIFHACFEGDLQIRTVTFVLHCNESMQTPGGNFCRYAHDAQITARISSLQEPGTLRSFHSLYNHNHCRIRSPSRSSSVSRHAALLLLTFSWHCAAAGTRTYDSFFVPPTCPRLGAMTHDGWMHPAGCVMLMGFRYREEPKTRYS